MHAAGVIADHPAKIAVLMRGRIRTKRQVVLIGTIAQVVQRHSRLHPRILFLRIDLQNLVQVLGEINHNGNIAALPGKACAAAPGQNRRAIFAGQRHRLNYILDCFRNDHADGHLAVVGAVRGIECAAAVVETHLAIYVLAQLSGQRIGAVTGESLVSGRAETRMKFNGLRHCFTS